MISVQSEGPVFRPQEFWVRPVTSVVYSAVWQDELMNDRDLFQPVSTGGVVSPRLAQSSRRLTVRRIGRPARDQGRQKFTSLHFLVILCSVKPVA
jgi:hypothetical protein